MSAVARDAAARHSRMRSKGLCALFGLIGTTAIHAGEDDWLFRHGFEPCCSLGGEVDGLTGDGLILHLQAGPVDEDKAIPANAGLLRLYTFATSLPGGTGYLVSFTSQPAGQNCTLSNASGTLDSTPVENINVSCAAIAGLIWDQGNWDAANWQ